LNILKLQSENLKLQLSNVLLKPDQIKMAVLHLGFGYHFVFGTRVTIFEFLNGRTDILLPVFKGQVFLR
jgi:hypothetical protein